MSPLFSPQFAPVWPPYGGFSHPPKNFPARRDEKAAAADYAAAQATEDVRSAAAYGRWAERLRRDPLALRRRRRGRQLLHTAAGFLRTGLAAAEPGVGEVRLPR